MIVSTVELETFIQHNFVASAYVPEFATSEALIRSQDADQKHIKLTTVSSKDRGLPYLVFKITADNQADRILLLLDKAKDCYPIVLSSNIDRRIVATITLFKEPKFPAAGSTGIICSTSDLNICTPVIVSRGQDLLKSDFHTNPQYGYGLSGEQTNMLSNVPNHKRTYRLPSEVCDSPIFMSDF
ncbi:hypothetical protein CROQUDRAFT_94017 [Cronartium quercuum f. sp. fusiforme G11]|uniref:Uncharacterized protein n=1 Tax=Cronartium quercuum f. sp. fusiforme G11 TaxID=708437 RepID=A0A9P6NEF8_9BASI|nr:hypothetical protein CROQUDRAFT_94017 [Cronartium quercuum f. sp. fusiforme G11]